MEFHTVKAYSSLGVTEVKCNIHNVSSVEMEGVIVRIKPSILADIIIVIIIMMIIIIIMHLILNVLAQHQFIIKPSMSPRPTSIEGLRLVLAF
jgi:hypothetical protein